MLTLDLLKLKMDGHFSFLWLIMDRSEHQESAPVSYFGHEERECTQKYPAVSFAGVIYSRELTEGKETWGWKQH